MNASFLRGLRDRLGYRLAAAMAVVLLPLTVISVVKSIALLDESRARSEAALMGETMRAASGELRLIQEARGAATALAKAIWPLVGDTERCSQLLRGLRQDETQYSLIAFVPLDGISLCNSEGHPFDFSDDPLFRRASREIETSFAVKPVGLVTHGSVLVIGHPVLDEFGRYQGFITLSLPHSGLRVAQDSGEDDNLPLTMITFDPSGTVLTASRQMDDLAGALPGNRPLFTLTGAQAQSFSARSQAGRAAVFSVVPLVPGELFALGSWPPQGAGSGAGTFGSVPVLFPALMWVASLLVAWLAVEQLVLRHIRKLSRSLTSFADGSRVVGDIDVRAAPAEIREMAEAYESMTETILHDEAELEDMVHQKEVLLREVHHRVKNNLQLIASIMNMQMRRTRSPEAKVLMKGLQDRIMSLATIHRELYQTAGLSDVHSDELLAKIVRQITNMADRPDRRFVTKTELADIRMTPDQAVPLALLVSEAVTNALKYAGGTDGGPAELWILLTRTSEKRAELRIGNTVAQIRPPSAPDDDDEGQERVGLGTQLVGAFAMQLGGTVERLRTDTRYELVVSYEIRPLTEGEERSAASEDGAPELPDAADVPA